MIWIEEAARWVGPGHPTFIVAEVSCNHAGSLKRARSLVYQAALAGADAVKFQVYTPGELTADSDRPAYRMKKGPWAGRRLWDLYQEAQTPSAWCPELFALARSLGLVPFASVFGPVGLSEVAPLNPSLYKIASAEVADPWLVEAVAKEGRPVIVSDGMATPRQLATALDILQEKGAMLHCVSAYPAKPGAYCLQLIRQLAPTVLTVGISDHTPGVIAAPMAVAAGATIVEKHLMLPRWRYWRKPLDWDHSADPAAFAATVAGVRIADEMNCAPVRFGRPAEEGGPWRRRLVFLYDMRPGVKVTFDLMRTARAGDGMEPDEIEEVLGRKLTVYVKAGDPVVEEAFR